MEMPPSQWWSELGMEDPGVGQCNNEITEPTEEQLEALMGYRNNFDYESDTFLTGYPSNVKLPATVDCRWGISPSGGSVSYDRRRKQSIRANTLLSSNNDQQPLVSTPPSIYVPNSQQKLQHQQQENYFTHFFLRIANETDDTNQPASRNPRMEAEIVAYGGHAHNCNSDAAFNVCSRQLLGTKLGPSDARISNVTSGNGLSRNQLANKASSQNKDHIMAERKRREKVSQRFIALSSILPELKKTDKASILGEAIKYMQRLQDRIKELEEQGPKKTPVSVLYVKKTKLSADDQETDKAISYSSTNSSSEIKNYTSSEKAVTEGVTLTPEIEIRVVNRNVIIHIHCEMEKSLLLKSFAELEKLQLTVVNASVLSFSGCTLDLTFNAQMEDGCDLTVKDINKAVQALFKK